MSGREKYAPSPEVLKSRQANLLFLSTLRNRIIAAERMEPQDWQEAHDTTVPYMVKVDAERETELTRRRSVDQVLWDALSRDQEQAALDVQEAFELVTGGMSCVTARYSEQRSPGTVTEYEPEHLAILQTSYWAWGAACVRAHLSCAAALDVLCFGLSCNSVDRNRRKARHWSRKNLFSALDLYCQIRGWQKNAS